MTSATPLTYQETQPDLRRLPSIKLFLFTALGFEHNVSSPLCEGDFSMLYNLLTGVLLSAASIDATCQ